MTMNYEVKFKTTNLGMFALIPGLKEAMQNELFRVYNIYAEKTNSGITEMLNKQFDQLYPDYFKNNSDKEWYDLALYNKFMANGYQYHIVNELNKTGASPLLDFYVDPEEVVFKGRLKMDHRVEIEFYLEET